ncbi:PP2C family protein-serine/threonine phosphatase [Xanthomonas arboricola]|uniref:PP2C family protein-serine/threonine phosphatase n=1 Tax=Xanthomonas arboricola TaxID=56448 RepID=UPI000C845179|nr:protein phosphatase 2C domain-containing protein [Xanthomonas arboricola]SOU01052.1 serine/threonine specific protein phosphatase [Xanthomonas arboricola pv. fragariae]
MILLECSGFSYPKTPGATNQDAWLPPKKLDRGYLIAVADGVGSYPGAEYASGSVINYLDTIKQEKNLIASEVINGCRDEIIKISQRNPQYKNAATTLTFCYISENGILLGHVGDSRAYLRDGDKLLQLTKDHTQHQSLFDQGIYTRRELKNHSGENTLTSALSKKSPLIFQEEFIPIKDIDSESGSIELFLMSDGAHRMWTARPRFSIPTLSSPARFSSALKRRIDRFGATDDQTLICVKLRLIGTERDQTDLF